VKPALLLVDIQNDFLRSPELSPAAEAFLAGAARLLDGCRQAAVPVVHVWTTVRRGEDRRMPHWVRAGKWMCVMGTEGHATPAQLRPRPEDKVVNKTFFSAFHTGELAQVLAAMGCNAVVIAGLYEHACVRTTAIDAYQAGLEVWIPTDAVASNDAVHAAISRRYLAERAARYEPVETLLARLSARHDPLNLPMQQRERAQTKTLGRY
jgi:alpha-ketoglutaric semialdehyde dehydrogenase